MPRKKVLNSSSVPGLLVDLADKLVAQGSFVTATELNEFVDRMDREAPGVIDGYVVDNRVRYLITDFDTVLADRRRRSRPQSPGSQSPAAAGRNARAGRFAAGVDDAVGGGKEAVSAFLATCSVDGVQMTVGAMRGEDHAWVAEMRYGRPGRAQLMLESFHKAVAKRCGAKRTDEVFTEEAYQKLYRSIVNDD